MKFRGYAETFNRNLSDLLSAMKNSKQNLFDELLRKKGVLNILYVLKLFYKNELMIMSLILKHFTLIH